MSIASEYEEINRVNEQLTFEELEMAFDWSPERTKRYVRDKALFNERYKSITNASADNNKAAVEFFFRKR